MSVKGRRCVTFEEPDRQLGLSEPNLVFSDLGSSSSNFKSSLTTICKNDNRSRSSSRSKSWSRLRSRRTNSYDVLFGGDSSGNISGSLTGISDNNHYEGRLSRTGSRSSVRNLVRLFETRSPNEGRRSQVVLIDDRQLDILIQPKLYTSELLDLVASHVSLKEKKYFGLGFLDDTNQFNWLQGEKRVLDHEFPSKTGLLTLHFAIKFYVDSIGLLRDNQTVELFYLNARQFLFKGQLHCQAETVFELAALVLQATHGDYESDEITKTELKNLPVIPTSTLQQHPSIEYCEERIITHYERISGTSRGLAIVNYMTIIERLETYGIHFYDVKDKRDIPWLLGISPRGIAIYDKADRGTHRKLFNWKNLENLYYRDKRFSIEVHNTKRLSVNKRVSKNINVHTWFASSNQLIKCIWSMAVIQHQFYLDKKQTFGHLSTARSMSEVAANLSRSSTSLPGSLGSDFSHSSSSHSLHSLTNSRYDLTIEQIDTLKADREMFQALKSRHLSLQESLRKKTEELKVICLQEAELTGQLPKDMPLSPGERAPAFRRRVGTSFSLSVKDLEEHDQITNELSKMKLEVELQEKITAAANRLATDKTVTKFVRKQRKQSYSKAQGKLREMKKKLENMERSTAICPSEDHHSSRVLDHHSGRLVDGMYNSVQPVTKCDLDLGHIVNRFKSRRQDNSCGNSIDSCDMSVGSEATGRSKHASSGYCSASAGSVSSSSHWLNNDDISSFCGSISTVKSSNPLLSEYEHSFSAGDSRNISLSSTLNEDFTLTRSGRKKHFIISRGPQSNRVQEFFDEPDVSRSLMGSKCDHQTKLHLATSENDLDLDSTLDDSFLGSGCINDYENNFRDEEDKVCTRVERRRQTFIASRKLIKSIKSHIRSTGFEKGWETFQHILMGEDIGNKDEDFVDNKPCRSQPLEDKEIQQERTHQDLKSPNLENKRRHESQKLSTEKKVELQQKIQELINKGEPEKTFIRSRSFDSSHDCRINKSNSVATKSKDDSRIGSTKNGYSNKNKIAFGTQVPSNICPNKNKECTVPGQVQPKSRESSAHIKNPFNFLTRRQNKLQQKHENETHNPVLHGGATPSTSASHASTGASRTSTVHIPCVNKSHVDDSKRHTHYSSTKTDATASTSDKKNISSITTKTNHHQTTCHSHCPRSALEPSTVKSKRSQIVDNKHNSKTAAPNESSKQKQDLASISNDITGKGQCEQQTPRRRLSWHSNNKRPSTKGTETIV